jgi:ubiquinone biosynthesis protein UbiJ
VAQDPALRSAALAGLERAANAALALSPHSRRALAALAGRVVAIECTAPAFSVYLQPTEDGDLRLQGVHEGPVDARVRGSSSDFAELAGSDDPTATLINGNLVLEGSSAPLIELQRVFAGLDVDWEAPLVAALGDVAGHQAAQLLRGAFRWTRDAGRSLARQLEEFVHEEARLTPPRTELEDFYADVQSLGLAVDRLETRLERLRGRLARLAGPAADA